MNNIEQAIKLLEEHIEGLENIRDNIEVESDDDLQQRWHYDMEIENVQDALTYLTELV